MFKPRFKSKELRILECLSTRMTLSEKEENHYFSLKKGYEGEQKFDEWLEQLPDNHLVLNDLLLEKNNTTFQLDSLLLRDEIIHSFEVKNFEGDYVIKDERWYSTTSRTEIKNPLLQLRRSESLLRQLLHDYGFHFQVESYVVFVNPEFHLYQAPMNQPIIYPTQINRFMNKFKKNPRRPSDKCSKLANLLVSLHMSESPYTRLPKYTYEEVEKGIICLGCGRFISEPRERKIECKACGHTEMVDDAIYRNTEEFMLLFPDKKVTTGAIYEWCNVIKSKKTIRRVLSNNFKIVGYGKSASYVKK